MKRIPKLLPVLLAMLVLAFTLAACGSRRPRPRCRRRPRASRRRRARRAGADGDVIQKDSANASKTITVGSKNFAEQFILGEIYAQALEAAGFTVKKELNLGSEQIAFKALKCGEIDAYPEYTGTALTSFYKVKTDDVPRDPQAVVRPAQGRPAKDDITAMPQTPFENTYKVASTKETAREATATRRRCPSWREGRQEACVLPASRSAASARTACSACRQVQLVPKFVSSQGQYSDFDAGQADFTMGFSTDGPLSTGKYVTYEDDKGLFPPYYVTLLVRDDAAKKLGDDRPEGRSSRCRSR